MRYRSDIDGLRAIAIIFVLVHHGGLSLFPSGFVGVDVFFVISGFLITGIIQRSLEQGQFSFLDFYSRRLWRLQPVFICLLLVTSLLALLFFLPDDLLQFNRSARKSSLFLSNVYFGNTTTGYFAPDTMQLPLRHTWSLSIEWQCYFILPVVLYFLHRFFNRQHITWVLFLLALGFLFLAWYLSGLAPEKSYYQFSSRIFEFLIGALVSTRMMQALSFTRLMHNVLAGIALTTLFYVATRSNIMSGYPNGYALVVCLATGLLIMLGKTSESRSILRFLSSKPLVFIGLISYSLYIWHWVVFAFIRYQAFNETPLLIITALLFTVIIAWLSWRFIEKPARQFNHLPFYSTIAGLILLPVAVIHLNDYVAKHHSGFPERFGQELVTVYQQLDRYQSAQRPLCIGEKNTAIPENCIIGARNPDSKKALLIGDSFSNHYWGFVDTLAKAANVSTLAHGTSSCITLPGIYLYDWWHFKNDVYQVCHDQTERYFNLIKANHYDYVMIGQVWINYYLGDHVVNQPGDKRSFQLSQDRIQTALDKALKIIIASGARPVLLKTSALMKANGRECFFQHLKRHQDYDPKLCQVTLDSSRTEWIDTVFLRMQKKYPQLIVIDPKLVQCVDDHCDADINGIPMFRDVGHLTDYASYQLGKLYLQRHGNPFERQEILKQ